MGGIIAKQGTTVDLGCVWFNDAGGAATRANPPAPKIIIVDNVGIVVGGFGPAGIAMVPGNVPVGGVIVGLWLHTWAIPGGQAVGHYRVYYFDSTDPINNFWANPASEELWIVAKDFDDLYTELRKIEDNAGAFGTVWNPATHNLVATYLAATAGAADALASKTAAQLARDRLGADADANPVGGQTKYLAAVSLGAPVAGSIGALVQNLSGVTLASIADAVWDEVITGHAVAGSFGKNLPFFLGVGAGNIFVDHNYGGADNLQFRNSATLAGVQDGTVRIFLKSDWDANLRSVSFMKAWWSTDSNGRALGGCFLAAAIYTAVAYRTRAGGLVGIKLKTKDFTVV